MKPKAMPRMRAVVAEPAVRQAGLLALIELPNDRFAPT
jgi:hypothetical protein